MPHVAKSSQSVVQTLLNGGMPDGLPTLFDILPLLQEMYNVPSLQVIKTTERYCTPLTKCGMISIIIS